MLLPVVLCLAASSLALPTVEVDKRQALAPSVTIQNGTVVGSSQLGVESFNGIPFAQPPTGTRRLRLPQTITAPYGTITATGTPLACPQFYSSPDTSNLVGNATTALEDTPFAQQEVLMQGEDCLTLNVQRPAGTNTTSKLPVVLWIYGGGFEFGSTQSYDGSSLIRKSQSLGQQVLYVAMNYRLNGFGFLAGQELKNEGNTNLGLHDQRLAMQWVADNVAAFGGDADRVTLWGESAGSISVFDHTIINGGDNTYNGKPLFRGGIMDSGSVVAAEDVGTARPQAIFDQVAAAAGCGSAADKLACLRAAPYATFLNAVESVPAVFSYRSLDLSYLPRPDNSSAFFPVSPEQAVSSGNFTKVPIIIGDQQDEGPLFALSQTNISTTAQLVTYLQSYFPSPVGQALIPGFVATYPDDPAAGSPFNTGVLYNIYPQFKRLAAILGDVTFTLTRRSYLATVSQTVPSWSYLATYFYGTPILGTFHASDILAVYLGASSPVPTDSIMTYYISFVNYLDPNAISTAAPLIQWPQWSNATNSPQLLDFGALDNTLIPDTFRSASYDFLRANAQYLHV